MRSPAPLSTKTRILDAAERLFAERGFDATSHRDLTRSAGVNLAAVNYHFGSKQALLAAVFQRRIGPINAERLRRLDAAEAAADVPELESVVRAFLEPAFARVRRGGDGGAKFMQLVGRTHAETSEEIRACFVDQFDEVAKRFTTALARALDLPSRLAKLRLRFMVGSMAHLLVWNDTLGSSRDQLDELVAYTTAGLRAPRARRRR